VSWLKVASLVVWLVVGCWVPNLSAQVDYYWIGAPGTQDWGTAANWNPPNVPNPGDSAFLEQADTQNRIATYRNIFPTIPALNLIRINASGTGTMTLSLADPGLTGSLQVGTLYIGDTHQGLLHQTEGSLTATEYLYLGSQTGSSGSYTMEAGDLRANNLVVGEFGQGFFIQSQNTATPTNVIVENDFGLGTNVGGQGSYELLGGNLSANYSFVGFAGQGDFIQSGGRHTVTNELILGYVEGSQGNYELSGPGILVTNYTWVGNQGTGIVNQTGGDHEVAEDLVLGLSGGGSGTYDLRGGALEVGGDLFVGDGGSGAFTQTAGTNTVIGHLGVGRGVGGIGTFDVQGGDLDVGELYVGYAGNGTFTQTGGMLITNNIYLADEDTGRATYHFRGGTLTFRDPAEGSLNVGRRGIADFHQAPGNNLSLGYIFVDSQVGTSTYTQEGGNTTLNHHLGVGRSLSGRGEYNLQDGTLTMADLYLGYEGTGVFNQSGGTATVADTIWMAALATGNATYNLQAGALSATHLHLGHAGTGLFTQTGGTHTLTGDLNLATEPASSGTYNLQGGTLTAQNINLFPGGLFNQTGGTLNFQQFNHQGGEVQGSLENRGTYTYDSGTFTGRLINSGTAVFNADFTAGNGMAHFSDLTVEAGRSLTFNGQGLEIGAGGTITQNGGNLSAGTLFLNTGGRFIRNGGTLNFTDFNLRGGIYTGPLENHNNLTGFGLIEGDLANFGRVNPGSSPGTLNIQGSFTQAAAGVYVVELASPTNYDKIEVDGMAQVGGTVQPVLLGGYNPAYGQAFPGIITATGGISGEFSTILSDLLWKLVYHPDSIDLIRWGRDFADPGVPLTANQYNVGVMLNSVRDTASGDLAQILDTLSTMEANALPDAYQQISPDKAQILPAMSLAGAALQWRSLANRLTYLRWTGGEGGGGAGTPRFSGSRLAGLMLAYNGSDVGSLLTGRQTQAPDRPWSIYADFLGTIGDWRTTPNRTGYDFNIFGFNLGFDYRFGDKLILGAGTGYYHTSADYKNSGGSSKADSIPFFVYGAYYPGNFYAFGSLGYTLNLYDMKRNFAFGGINRVAQSSVNGSQFNAGAETGYDLKLARVIITPNVSLNYSKVWVGSFSETGAGALSLNISSQEADSLQSGVGVRLSCPFKAGKARVVPQVAASYQHEFSNDSRGLNARLSQTGGTFSYRTESPRRDFAVLGAGVAVEVKHNVFLQANYNTEVGQSNNSTHNVSGVLRWSF